MDFPKQIKLWFLVNLHHSLESWKDEQPILSKTEVQLSNKYKISLLLCFFWGILQFSQQFHCKIYIWRWRGPNLIFFLVISITLSFQIKQNLNSKNFVHMGFCGPKCWQNFNILQLAWSLTPNKFWTKYLRCLISIWLQLNHNGS